jgi:chemotaxis protein MotA
MNFNTILGIGTMLVLIAIACGENLGGFIDIPSVQIVVLGTFAGGFASFPLNKILGLPSVFGKIMFNEKIDPAETIKILVDFAEKARRDGILALDKDINNMSDQFMKSGLQLAADGSEGGLIRDILKTEISGIEARHQSNAAIFSYMSALAPAMGMIGTFVGLVLMLGNLSDIDSLGPNMAIAILTSLYGAIMSNCMFTPLENILVEKSQKEMLVKNIILEGVVSIQMGEHPRIVEEKLAACLDPLSRTKVVRKK